MNDVAHGPIFSLCKIHKISNIKRYVGRPYIFQCTLHVVYIQRSGFIFMIPCQFILVFLAKIQFELMIATKIKLSLKLKWLMKKEQKSKYENSA